MPKLYPGYREEIRKKIVNEAFTVFLAKGFEKTTMDDIAARLGVTKPAIYRYYRNKEELFIAAGAEAMVEEFKQVFTTSFSSGDLITGAGFSLTGTLRSTASTRPLQRTSKASSPGIAPCMTALQASMKKARSSCCSFSGSRNGKERSGPR